MNLAELGEIAKETPHPYYGSELEAADKRRLAERTREHEIRQTQVKQKQNAQVEESSRKAQYERTRQQNPATPPVHTGGGGPAPHGPVADADVPTGDHRTASRGMSNEDWKKHWESNTHNTGTTQASSPAGELDRIRANRAADEAAHAAHISSGARGHAPVPEHAAHAVKEGAGKYKQPFKLPKGSKRAAGGVAGIGALTTGAMAMHAKRIRDASG